MAALFDLGLQYQPGFLGVDPFHPALPECFDLGHQRFSRSDGEVVAALRAFDLPEPLLGFFGQCL